MRVTFKTAESTNKPAELEVRQGVVYMRKDIAEEERDGLAMYTYQEAVLSHDEYREYVLQEELVMKPIMQEITAIELTVDSL